MDPTMIHFYLDIFLQTLARDLPWILGGLGAVGLAGYSPVGRAVAASLRQRHRDVEIEETLSAQLADLQRTLSEVTERLDATEQRMLRQALSAPARPAESEPGTGAAGQGGPLRIATPA